MNEVVLISTLLSLFFALVAVFGLIYLLRWLDRSAGFEFKEIMTNVAENPLAMAVYLGLRFLGVCLLVGAIIK